MIDSVPGKASDAGGGNSKLERARRFLTVEPFDLEQGHALLFSAVEDGDGEAARVASVIAACGLGVGKDWTRALDYLVRAAEAGNDRARAELMFLAAGETPPLTTPPIDWERLRRRIDLESWFATPPPRAVMNEPRIGVVEKFASREVCDWLIARGQPHLEAATVFDPVTGLRRPSEGRSNSAFAFDIFAMDIVFAVLWERIGRATGLAHGMEAPNILHYAVGQRYEPHFDFIEAKDSGDAALLTRGAQRVITFLLYLNDDYDGGETDFPALGWKYKSAKGDAMFFWSVNRLGQPDRRTLHTGRAPTRGEKWVYSQWLQARIAAP
jgi:hypothetical protein